jgi:hypothetical protein
MGGIIQLRAMDLASSPPPPVCPKRRRVSDEPYDPQNSTRTFKSPEDELAWLRQENNRLVLIVESMKRLLSV